MRGAATPAIWAFEAMLSGEIGIFATSMKNELRMFALPIVLVALNIWTQSHVSCRAKEKEEEEYTAAKINSEMHCTHHQQYEGVFVYALQLW